MLDPCFYAVLCVRSSFAIFQLVNRNSVTLLLLSSGCHVEVIIFCLLKDDLHMYISLASY